MNTNIVCTVVIPLSWMLQCASSKTFVSLGSSLQLNGAHNHVSLLCALVWICCMLWSVAFVSFNFELAFPFACCFDLSPHHHHHHHRQQRKHNLLHWFRIYRARSNWIYSWIASSVTAAIVFKLFSPFATLSTFDFYYYDFDCILAHSTRCLSIGARAISCSIIGGRRQWIKPNLLSMTKRIILLVEAILLRLLQLFSCERDLNVLHFIDTLNNINRAKI